MANDPEGISSSTDIGELQDTLGVIIASYTYLFDPWARIEEVNHMITFEGAILQGLGKYNVKARGTDLTYRQLFKMFRTRWQKAVDAYEQENGGWKDSLRIISELRDSLMRIAVQEGLITLSSDMFTIQIPQMPGGQQGGQPQIPNK